mgnify:CR=1 FL=1
MMGLASIGSVTAVLIILGFVLIIVLNVNNVALIAKETFDEIAVYLYDDVDEKQIEELGKSFKDIDGVMGVAFQTKEYALEKLKEDWGENAYLLEGIRDNSLPNTYIVQLKDVENSEHVENQLRTFEGVEKVQYHKDAVNSLMLTLLKKLVLG